MQVDMKVENKLVVQTDPTVSDEINKWSKKEPEKKTFIMKVAAFARKLFKRIAAGLLFLVSPGIFAGGYFIGIIWDVQARTAIKKIQKVWNAYSPPQKFLAFLAIGYALPISLAAGSFFDGLWIGSVTEESLKGY